MGEGGEVEGGGVAGEGEARDENTDAERKELWRMDVEGERRMAETWKRVAAERREEA